MLWKNCEIPNDVPCVGISESRVLDSDGEGVSQVDATAPTSAVEVYWQLGCDSLASRVLTELLECVLEEPLYHQLRTTEQLGYIVFSGLRCELGVVGLRVLVQSSEVDAATPQA